MNSRMNANMNPNIDPISSRRAHVPRDVAVAVAAAEPPRGLVPARWIALLLLALSLLLVACGGNGEAGEEAGDETTSGEERAAGPSGEDGDDDSEAGEGEDDEAEPRPTLDRRVVQVVTADGELRFPEEPHPATFSTAGRLLEVPVEVDDEVTPGQLLARIDDTGLRQAVAEARAALIGARQALSELEAGTEVERARLQLEQSKNNRWGTQAIRDATCGREKPFFDQASCDQADANTNAAEQSVQLAELAYQRLVAQRETELSAARTRADAAALALVRAETALEGARLTAPITATITDVALVPGVDVSPGTPVMTLVRTRPLQFVTSNLGERFVGQIRPGDPARITLTGYTDREIEATVERIEPQGTRDSSGAVVFPVHLLVDAPDDLALYAGMTGRVEIDVAGGSE